MEQINNSTNTPVWLELESKEHQLYSQTKRFLEEEEFEKAKEHVIQLFELLGGDEECKKKGFHELFYLRGEIKTKIPEPSHDDFLIAYQILHHKNVVNTKSVTIEEKKEDNNENVPEQQERVNSESLPEPAVSTSSSTTQSLDSPYIERLDQLKNSLNEQLQQQSESILQQNQKIQEQQTHIQQLQQQNEFMLQAFNQQNQMFQQMQNDVIQLQQKMESLTNQTQHASSPTTAPVTSETSNSSTSSSAPTQTEQVRRSVTPEEAKPQPAVEPAEDATSKARSESTPVQNNNTDTPKSRTATTITPSTSTSFIRPSYTMEGWLHKLGGWNKTKWESRYFSCDGIELVYHSSQQIIQTTSPKGNIYVKDIIAVEEVHFDVHRVNHCFAIQTPIKKYFFYADDEVSKKNWIAALKKK